ncbi:MAG TPA: hypothetical protein DDW51_05705 [Cyanobacteria bacterium UBA11367]|nr:hypothetical protein [Cyanobacteria bacterium UBA11367]HBE56778.1 hypothetical protein [Cyanobacteria bacterium UBA11366]HBK83946.1 hypothetical protein [Flavobacterium sp.]
MLTPNNLITSKKDIMTKVLNIKSLNYLGTDRIYIGRANQQYQLPESILSNPFLIGKDGTRAEVVEKYRKWLWSEHVKPFIEMDKSSPLIVELLKLLRINERREISLVCWCTPALCHGHIIAKCLDFLAKEGY